MRKAITNGIAIIRHHRLLGVDADAEVRLDHRVSGVKLAGRADFIMHRMKPHDDKIILDGKGSKWFNSFVDATQLLWYAMLYRLWHGSLPDKLGFVFWRATPENSVSWVDFTPEDIDAMQTKALDAVRCIEAGKKSLPVLDSFPAVPGADCKWCSFLSVCPPGCASQKEVGADVVGGVEDVGV